MRRFLTYGPALVVLAAVAVVLAAAPSAIRQAQVAQLSGRIDVARATLEQGSMLEQLNAEVNAIADAVFPGIVHIVVRGRGGPFSFATGSGWFFDDEGHIVTNAHVVGGMERVRVELYDGRVRTARVVAVDEQTDIALLKVDPGAGVMPLVRGSGRELRTGEAVFAFGSPFGIKFSMSQGIVSGLGRSEAAPMLGMIGGYTNFIQTDAAVNPGNSGGPLVDVNGEVIGMNAAIANNIPDRTWDDDEEEDDRIRRARPQGQSAGIGFAIPLDTIEAVVAQLIKDNGVVLRGYLGVELSGNAPSNRGYDGPGVVIRFVVDDHPAGDAGLRAGDVVLSIDGRETPNVDVLRSLVSVRSPGSGINVRFWRGDDDGGEIDTTIVRLGAAFNNGRRLQYVEGSEDMTEAEIFERIEAMLR
jgi:serine protease Do